MGTGAAVVTGAASGIGRALAHALHGRGARVVLADRDRDALEVVAGELHAPAVCMDVTSADDYERLAQAAGPADLVCLNAGISSVHGGPVWETPAAQWQQVMDVNLGGLVHGLRTFVPRLLAAERPGHVLVTASLAGLLTWPGRGCLRRVEACCRRRRRAGRSDAGRHGGVGHRALSRTRAHADVRDRRRPGRHRGRGPRGRRSGPVPRAAVGVDDGRAGAGTPARRR